MKKWLYLLTFVSIGGAAKLAAVTGRDCFASLPAAVSDSVRLSYFCASYETCREQFNRTAQAFIDKLPAAERAKAQVGKWKIPSKVDDSLYTDWLFLPARKEPKSLVVVTSGVHGVEGFMGSAIQKYLLEELLPGFDRDTTGVILVHAINPYGFKYLRRVSENNVDLNRNFDTNRELFNLRNPAYANLNGLLNPVSPVRYDYAGGASFLLSAVQLLAKEKVASIRNAALQGQYDFPLGIYYGGKDFEPHKDLFEKFMDEKAEPYGSVMHLDVHTGYGSKAHLHLFPSEVKDATIRAAMLKVFAGYKIDEGSGDDFYASFGDIAIYTMKRMRQLNKKVVPMTLEYGTNDNQGILGGVQSLRLSILENQFAHFGATTPARAQRLKEDYLELFFPKSPSWRLSTMKATAQWLPIFMDRFSKLD